VPIFEYHCRSCGQPSEQLVLSSTPEPVCPSCGSADLEKLISASAVSSSSTQKRALGKARQRTDKVRFEREWESHKAAHDHDHD
jgi:putative FmdB family regulatory protein